MVQEVVDGTVAPVREQGHLSGGVGPRSSCTPRSRRCTRRRVTRGRARGRRRRSPRPRSTTRSPGTRSASRPRARTDMRQLERWSCCPSPTTSGASTSTRSTTWRRASTSARTDRRTRWSSSSARRTAMFDEMKGSIVDEFVRYIYRVELVARTSPRGPGRSGCRRRHGRPAAAAAGTAGRPPSRAGQRQGPAQRARAPAGHGRKYKKCHGATA